MKLAPKTADVAPQFDAWDDSVKNDAHPKRP